MTPANGPALSYPLCKGGETQRRYVRPRWECFACRFAASPGVHVALLSQCGSLPRVHRDAIMPLWMDEAATDRLSGILPTQDLNPRP